MFHPDAFLEKNLCENAISSGIFNKQITVLYFLLLLMQQMNFLAHETNLVWLSLSRSASNNRDTI